MLGDRLSDDFWIHYPVFALLISVRAAATRGWDCLSLRWKFQSGIYASSNNFVRADAHSALPCLATDQVPHRLLW
jgi:hypothetical protein